MWKLHMQKKKEDYAFIRVPTVTENMYILWNLKFCFSDLENHLL